MRGDGVIIYVLIMACHSDRARTLSVGEFTSPRGGAEPRPPHHYPLRADLDKGGLKVGQGWERIPSTGRQSASLRSPESGAGREGLGTGDWGLGTRLSVASCARASSPRGTGGSGLALIEAGYYKRNNICSNLRITHKIKHTPILQNEAVNPFRINESFPRRAHN
jgi:hypothetical protein